VAALKLKSIPGDIGAIGDDSDGVNSSNASVTTLGSVIACIPRPEASGTGLDKRVEGETPSSCLGIALSDMAQASHGRIGENRMGKTQEDCTYTCVS